MAIYSSEKRHGLIQNEDKSVVGFVRLLNGFQYPPSLIQRI